MSDGQLLDTEALYLTEEVLLSSLRGNQRDAYPRARCRTTTTTLRVGAAACPDRTILKMAIDNLSSRMETSQHLE